MSCTPQQQQESTVAKCLVYNFPIFDQNYFSLVREDGKEQEKQVNHNLQKQC